METNCENKELYEKIEKIYVLLKEIKSDQQDMEYKMQKNHAVNMKKMGKLQEYNQIADMTNQIFELRITEIEQALKKLNLVLVNSK